MKSRCEQHCNATWIDFQLNWIELNNWIKIQFNWIQIQKNGLQIGRKGIQNILKQSNSTPTYSTRTPRGSQSRH